MVRRWWVVGDGGWWVVGGVDGWVDGWDKGWEVGSRGSGPHARA